MDLVAKALNPNVFLISPKVASSRIDIAHGVTVPVTNVLPAFL